MSEHIPSASHWGHFSVEVSDGEVIGITAADYDPDPSPILASIPTTLKHPTRIARPMVRAGYLERGPGKTNDRRGSDRFVPLGWDEVSDLLAGELQRVKREHGNEAIFAGSYGWASAGRFHHAQSQVHRFLNGFGGYTASLNTYSTAAMSVILPYILGSKDELRDSTMSWDMLAEHSELVVMFGGIPVKNAQVNPGGLGSHMVRGGLEKAREHGVQFVNLSPLRDDSLDTLDAQWLAVRPSTDTAVLLGLAHTVLELGRQDDDFLASNCVGYERFRDYIMGREDGQPKTAKWAAAISGLEASAIRDLAERMTTKRTFISLSWSVQRTHHGEQPYWACVSLAAMLGQLGLPGAGVGFGYGAIGGIGRPTRNVPLPTFPQGRNPTRAFIPVARITDLLLHPRRTIDYNGQRVTFPETKLVYWCGGNPFHHHQDLNRLLAAWRRPDTIVIQDPWWTPAARHADIVLPATTVLERNDIGVARHDPHMTVMRQAVAPVGEARSDFDIFRGLAKRLGFEDTFTDGRSEMEWLEHMYEVARQQAAAQAIAMPDFETFWTQGSFRFPDPDDQPVQFADFRAAPERHPLTTPSGKVELFSETIDAYGYDDCPGHAAWMEPCEWLGSPEAERFPLHLVSNQPHTRLHSQLDPGTTSVLSKIDGREPARIHPDEAARRGIADGDVVRIFNDRGACLAGMRLSEDVRPEVIELATGAWLDPLEPGVIDPAAPGSLCVHGNPNVLTRDIGTSKLAQGPSAHTALVQVERYDGELPAIKVFEPPSG